MSSAIAPRGLLRPYAFGNALGSSLADSMGGDDYSRWATDDTETQRFLARYPSAGSGGEPSRDWFAGARLSFGENSSELRLGGSLTDEPFVDSDTWDLQGQSRAVGVAGREAARGASGIARSLAGDGAGNAEVNRVKNQLLALNPELADVVKSGQRYYVPAAGTPENRSLAMAADARYQTDLRERYVAEARGDLAAHGDLQSAARAGGVDSLTSSDWSQQAQILGSQAKQLADAAKWALANGMTAAANEYQQAANGAYYAEQNASLQALSINAASQASISPSSPLNPFAQGWNTGDYSAALPSGKGNVDGKYSIGLYDVIGGEVEIEIKDNSLSGLKVGLGVGAGGHYNLGERTIGTETLRGLMHGYKTDLSSEPLLGTAAQPGDYRIAPSTSLGCGIGTVGYEIGATGGIYSNAASGVDTFYEVNHSFTASATLPKASCEVKLNLFEFSYRLKGNSR